MNAAQRDLVDRLVAASPVLGADVDIRYRVLAITVEPPADLHPRGAVEDRRLQVVVHPVGTIAAAMVDHADPTRPTVLQFDETQLSDVVAAFADTVSTVPVFPPALPDVDALGDRLSMYGTAQTGDGTASVLHVHLVQPDGALELDVWAGFDELEVRGPDGTVVA
jgi:hypothetical protein